MASRAVGRAEVGLERVLRGEVQEERGPGLESVRPAVIGLHQKRTCFRRRYRK